MKKITYIILSLFVLFPMTCQAAVATTSGERELNVYLFTLDECDKCEDVKSYIESKHDENNRIILNEINVNEKEEVYEKAKEILKFKSDNYPLIIIGTDYFIGYDNKKLDNAIKSYLNNQDYCNLVYRIENNKDISNCLEINKDIYKSTNSNLLLNIVLVIAIALIIGFIIFKLVGKNKRKK